VALLAVTVLTIVVKRRDHTALFLFVTIGIFNALLEAIGLISGYRTYEGLTVYATLLIGLSESGTAAAIVWMGTKASWKPGTGPVNNGTKEIIE
jgi:hypothetical protein